MNATSEAIVVILVRNGRKKLGKIRKQLNGTMNSFGHVISVKDEA